jgi:hypothetical protein
MSDIDARARTVLLDEGLHALSFPAAAPGGDGAWGVELPAVLVSAPLSNEFDPVEIVVSSGDAGAWLGPRGGTIVVKAPPGGGVVMLTVFGIQSLAEFVIDVRRLDANAGTVASPPRVALRPAVAPREIRHETLLHIQMQGDRRFAEPGWIGNRDARLQIEGIAIRPLETLQPNDIEYKAFGPNGLETPWISEGKLCGTRGRGLPLTGFAVRLAPRLRDQFDVVYEGAFFDSGVVGPHRNGEPCRATPFDEPLAAVNLRIVSRGGA